MTVTKALLFGGALVLAGALFGAALDLGCSNEEPAPADHRMGTTVNESQSGPLASSHFYGHYYFQADAGPSGIDASTLDGDIDLLGLSTVPSVGQAGAPSRVIVPDSTGTLVVVRAADGVPVTLTVATSGVAEPIQATKVVASGTTVTGAKVYW